MRGRPTRSNIRQNIVDILYYLEEAYGYTILKAYRDIFPRCAMKSIYYNLHKGVETGEMEIKEVRRETGDYSWGREAEKVYYKLGKEAKPRKNEAVNEYFENRKNPPKVPKQP